MRNIFDTPQTSIETKQMKSKWIPPILEEVPNNLTSYSIEHLVASKQRWPGHLKKLFLNGLSLSLYTYIYIHHLEMCLLFIEKLQEMKQYIMIDALVKDDKMLSWPSMENQIQASIVTIRQEKHRLFSYLNALRGSDSPLGRGSRIDFYLVDAMSMQLFVDKVIQIHLSRLFIDRVQCGDWDSILSFYLGFILATGA